jgi:recombination protein RecT
MADIQKVLSLVDMVGSEQKFKAYKGAVEKTIPKTIDFGRYWQMYVQIMQGFYKQTNVSDKDSILSCMFNAAKLGLNPDPVFGQIYFIPYKGVLTYQLGYKGMIELSRRSGVIKNVRAGLVYEKDNWEYYEDEKGQHYKIEPALAELDRGKELFGYSIFTDQDGNPHIHIMTTKHIDGIKKMVLARTPSSPWGNPLYEAEMRKKTVTRQQWKTEPWSVDVIRATENEEAIERGEVKKENHVELAGIVEGMVADIEEKQPEQELKPEMTADQKAFVDKL